MLSTQDTYKTSETNNKLATIQFRLDQDKINHTRIVYNFMDWLGDIGGIGEVLRFVFMVIFGNYLAFNSNKEVV